LLSVSRWATTNASRTLEVRTQPVAGGLRLQVSANAAPHGCLGPALCQLYNEIVPESLVAGLQGPVGLRSDNGRYSFTLLLETPLLGNAADR
jgi:hypothetical protein